MVDPEVMAAHHDSRKQVEGQTQKVTNESYMKPNGATEISDHILPSIRNRDRNQIETIGNQRCATTIESSASQVRSNLRTLELAKRCQPSIH